MDLRTVHEKPKNLITYRGKIETIYINVFSRVFMNDDVGYTLVPSWINVSSTNISFSGSSRELGQHRQFVLINTRLDIDSYQYDGFSPLKFAYRWRQFISPLAPMRTPVYAQINR